MKKTVPLSFKVTEVLKKKLSALAKKENRSLSNLVHMILEREVKKKVNP